MNSNACHNKKRCTKGSRLSLSLKLHHHSTSTWTATCRGSSLSLPSSFLLRAICGTGGLSTTAVKRDYLNAVSSSTNIINSDIIFRICTVAAEGVSFCSLPFDSTKSCSCWRRKGGVLSLNSEEDKLSLHTNCCKQFGSKARASPS